MKMRRTYLAALVLLVAAVGIAFAVVTLSLRENAPGVSNAPPLLAGCDPLTATPPNVPAGSSGGILFTCGPQGTTQGALTVNGPITASLTFSPIPSDYTAIYIIAHGASCTSTTTSTAQIFGTGSSSAVMFTNTVTTQYDYCGIFTNAPSGGLGTWAITWTWTQ